MIVLDTTVLVYAVGAEHPLRQPCRALIEAVRDGTVAATTTVEVVQEFAHVRARRQGRADAAGVARSYATLLAPLIVVDADDLRAGLDLFERHARLGAFDGVLAAAAVQHRARGLVSADGAFAHVDGLRHLDPARPDFLALLGPARG